jgi:hypothetical protein
MVELHDTIVAAQVVMWLVTFGVAVVVLVQVSNYFTGESPQTAFKAVRATLLVWGTAYIVYDVSGYMFALMMQDPTDGIHMPYHYTYWDWFREPFALKWYVLGYVPIIRFVPIIFALCAGSILHVFLLDTTYPIALIVFLAELVLNALALIAISFAINLALAAYVRDVVRPELIQQREQEIQEALASRAAPRSLRHLHYRIQQQGPQEGPVWRRVEAGWHSFNVVFDPLYGFLRPVTRHLPLPAQDFLDAGGWLLLLPALAGLAIAWPRIHRDRKRLHHRRRKADANARFRVLLSEIGDSLTGLGDRQIAVQGHPARLRLVVLAPAGIGTGMPAEGRSALLEAAVPGLAAIAEVDCPKVVSWADSRARDAFRPAAVDRVQFPESADESARWVLLIGDVAVPQGRYHLAVGLHSAEPTPARVLEVTSGKWSDLVSLRDVALEDQGL